MPILGNFLKTAVELSRRLTPAPSAEEAQRKELDGLLFSAKDTAFGQFYNFDAILDAEDTQQAFRESVPIFDYDQLYDRWWYQQQKEPNITWPGEPDFFALSSGTTGKEPKRIPVTEAMLDSMRSVSLAQIKSLANFDLPPEIFEKEILGLGSSINLQSRRGHLEGEISGINAHEAPEWFDFFYRPGRDIAGIDDWDERITKIVEKADQWDIGAIVGIPSWVLQMLQAIMEAYDLDSIHDLWPSLGLYATGGVAFEPFRASFDELMDKPVYYQDTYLASEGYFAFNARPDTNAMQLALRNGIYYEFIPFDESGFDGTGSVKDDPVVLGIHEVEADKDYALLVSTCAGTWRYLIGDTVKFTDLELHEIAISGRTKYFMNVVGSQLSEEKLNAGITHVSDELGVPINEFALAALQREDGAYYHQWVIGTEDDLPEDKACSLLDSFLAEANKNYAVARNKALAEVRLLRVPVEQLYDWVERRKKKGGQVKIPKVMPADDMQDLLEMIK
ncbi:MAG TPA: GH3 auxin-responsive promoter family protein [Saprospiraceae bacterium]|nr:GH3 auxin-responsive promoter family protein [Saprospiraceae bacterium]